MSTNSKYLTLDEAALYLGCSVMTIWRRRQKGYLKPIKDGNLVKYTVPMLDEYMNQRKIRT